VITFLDFEYDTGGRVLNSLQFVEQKGKGQNIQKMSKQKLKGEQYFDGTNFIIILLASRGKTSGAFFDSVYFIFYK
jgi:hypothetical protein